ncbi:Fic family protein [Bacterioplanoides sp.]|uniref:Fic family protein n=1 Tax=Bacterioplanoides sp. TaxID=2066072 RepID=UPI003B009C89
MNQQAFVQIKPNQAKALMLAKHDLSSLVHNAIQLENINFTLPEVQTILDGITIGGSKLTDQIITANQGKAWNALFAMIKNGEFEMTAGIACKLHGIAGLEEALEWGHFRTGGVLIAGTSYTPPKADLLPDAFAKMIDDMNQLNDIYDQAIHVFLTMARNQFFWDVNKRMGRFMMNGILLQAGYPAINLPASRQLEFNQLMLDFYESNNQGPMNAFMRSCLDSRAIEIMQE